MINDSPAPKRRRTLAPTDGVQASTASASPAAADSEAGAEEKPAAGGHVKTEPGGSVAAAEQPQATAQPSAPSGLPEPEGGAPSAVPREPSFAPVLHGAFAQRDLFFQQQEASGAITFKYLKNDGHPDHVLWLLALKNIFSRQLPNMPREYITRLVFDRRHRSVAVVRKDGAVIGGITYRPFHSQSFGEIAFCAVSASDQVKGFGSRLMSYTKEYAKEEDRLTHFLTYADNNAVTFFSKQGFTAEVTLERERWFGFIKDYDGGKLMESVLVPELSYTRMPQVLMEQRTVLNARLGSLIYPGLRHFDAPGAPPLAPDQIPGVEEAGWTPDAPGADGTCLVVDGARVAPTAANLRALGREAVAALRAHEDSPAFLAPVVAGEVPDYYDIIKDPMDVGKVERRLDDDNFYVTVELFAADVNRIWRNAQLYNAVDTYWHKAAGRLQHFFDQFMAERVVREPAERVQSPSGHHSSLGPQ